MDKSDLRIEQLQQYLDKKKGVVESDIKEYNQQLGKNYLHFFDWHADDLYKACYMDKNYKAIQGSSSNLVVISFLFQLSSSFLILLKVVDMFAF